MNRRQALVLLPGLAATTLSTDLRAQLNVGGMLGAATDAAKAATKQAPGSCATMT